MVILRVSNKDTNRYKYTKRKIYQKDKTSKKNRISFSEILDRIQALKEKGLISATSVNISISKITKK